MVRDAKTGETNNLPQLEKYVQKWPSGAWDKFADKKTWTRWSTTTQHMDCFSPSEGSERRLFNATVRRRGNKRVGPAEGVVDEECGLVDDAGGWFLPG